MLPLQSYHKTDRKLIIFGASGAAIKTADILINLKIPFEYFVDNNVSKWGSCLKGKPIKNPNILSSLPEDYFLIIASDYYEEIENQVLSLGFPLERIIQKEPLILESISKWVSIPKISSCLSSDKPTFIVDLSEGFGIGGIETWSYIVAKELCKYYSVSIYTKKDTLAPSVLKPFVQYFNFSYEIFWNGIQDALEEMKKQLPCIVLTNWYYQIFYAALLLKKRYPEQVMIIGMVHHDMLRYYRRNQIISNWLDSFLCVSTTVKNKMIEEFQIPSAKVFYMPVPIEYEANFVKKSYSSDKPIYIGFGARLTASKKRADLLIPLIKELEILSCDYILWIAGEGLYQEQIQTYINKKQLNNKIILLGGLDYEGMIKFWKSMHIVLSISDSEGIGLSILEGMSYGAVPVVTKTAGIEEFVQNDINGYICPLHNMKYIAEKIVYLSNHANIWKNFSKEARNIIKIKCHPKNYTTFFSETFVKNFRRKDN